MTDFNKQAIELLGADTPGVIADALQEAYDKGRAEMKEEAATISDEQSDLFQSGAFWWSGTAAIAIRNIP